MHAQGIGTDKCRRISSAPAAFACSTFVGERGRIFARPHLFATFVSRRHPAGACYAAEIEFWRVSQFGHPVRIAIMLDHWISGNGHWGSLRQKPPFSPLLRRMRNADIEMAESLPRSPVAVFALRVERSLPKAAHLPLVCPQFSDKATLIARHEDVPKLTVFTSRRQADETARELEQLRKNLAHVQDIVTSDCARNIRRCEFTAHR